MLLYFFRWMTWRVWGRSKFIFWPSAVAPIPWKSVFNTTTIPGNIISSLKFKMYIAYNNNKSVYKFMCLYTRSSTRSTKKTILKSQLPRGIGVVNLFSHFFYFFLFIFIISSVNISQITQTQAITHNITFGTSLKAGEPNPFKLTFPSFNVGIKVSIDMIVMFKRCIFNLYFYSILTARWIAK